MKERSIDLLLIEDDSDDAELVAAHLEGIEAFTVRLKVAGTLEEFSGLTEDSDWDLILLDLSLPDSEGLETLESVRLQKPDIPVVVLTGAESERIAVAAIRAGAQDFLSKNLLTAELLARTIRYSIERHWMMSQITRLTHHPESDEEIKRVSAFADDEDAPFSVSARLYGFKSIREIDPHRFRDMMARYIELTLAATEARGFRVEYSGRAEVRALADQLGFLKAGPRDVVEMQTLAIREITSGIVPQKKRVIREEAHFLTLELMGYLVMYYRGYTF